MKRDEALALLQGKTTNEQLGGKGIGKNVLIKVKEKRETIGTMPSRFNQSIKKQLKGEK